ncbi:FG-GAP repeat domain-containing protein, partial [Paraprevotella clara]
MVDREKNVKARYHWHVPGRYALDFKLDLPFTYLQEDRMMTHLNNDGVPDFANPVFTDLRKIEIALSGADGTYTLMDGCNSAYPLDVNHDGLPDLFAF